MKKRLQRGFVIALSTMLVFGTVPYSAFASDIDGKNTMETVNSEIAELEDDTKVNTDEQAEIEEFYESEIRSNKISSEEGSLVISSAEGENQLEKNENERFVGSGSVQSNNWVWPTYVHTFKNDWPNYSSGKYHGGTDFPVPLNTDVHSSCEGDVVSVKYLTTSYGKHIKIKAKVNGQVVYIRYCHLNEILVSEGQHVTAGQIIGKSGSTGNSTGPHLHYEVRNSADSYSNALNPRLYLPGTTYTYESQKKKVPEYSDFWTSQKLYDISETISITAVASNAETYTVGIDKEGVGRVVTQGCGSTYAIPASQLGAGKYSVYMTVANSAGCVDTNRLEFIITEKCNLGDQFSARIKNLGTGYYVTDRDSNVYGSEEDGSREQIWKFTRQGDGSYTLVNANDGLYMDDSYIDNPPAGANVHIWEGTGNWNQKFNIYYMNDSYYIRPANSTNLVLDMGAGDPYNVAIWQFLEGATQQRFSIEKIDFDGYLPENYGETFYAQICNMGLNTYLTYENGSTVGKEATGAKNQIWKLIRQPNGSYIIKSEINGLYLSVSDGNLLLKSTDESTAEKFYLYDTGNGLYLKSVNAEAGVLTLQTKSISLNTKKQNDVTQKWSLTEITHTEETFSKPVVTAYFNGHKYELYNESMTWQSAKKFCENKGGYLVTVTGDKENEFVNNLRQKSLLSDTEHNIWMGCSDEIAEGVWKWVTNENSSYTNWKAGEPNGQEKQNYMQMFSDGTWDDVENAVGRYVICEYSVVNDKPELQLNQISIGGRAADALRINWSKNGKASGYIIEQYKNGSWARIARIGNQNTITFRVEKLTSSTTYKFRVRAFSFDGSTPLYGNYAYINGKTNPSTVSGAKIGGRAGDALRLNWNKDSKASGYIIEQYKGGSWTRIARIGSNATTTYCVEKLTSSTTYKFRIKAFGFDGNTALYSGYTYASGKTNPAVISGLKIGGTAKDALRLNWNRDSKASGYIVEQYKNNKWVRIARIGSNATTTYRAEGLKSKTTCKFRVQAFGFDGSTALYGSYSYVSGVTR